MGRKRNVDMTTHGGRREEGGRKRRVGEEGGTGGVEKERGREGWGMREE